MVLSPNPNRMVIFLLVCVMVCYFGPILFYIFAINTPTSTISVAFILIFSSLNIFGFQIFAFIAFFIIPLFIILVLTYEYGHKKNRIQLCQMLSIMSASIIAFYVVIMCILVNPYWDLWGVPIGTILFLSFFIIAIIILIINNQFLSKQEI